MAESREHIWKYAYELVQYPFYSRDYWDDGLCVTDLREAWVNGAEWMRNRAEKRREKESLKYRRKITELRKEIYELKKKQIKQK